MTRYIPDYSEPDLEAWRAPDPEIEALLANSKLISRESDMIPSYTAAQLRALEWLPEDGAWRETTDDQTMTENIVHLFYRTSLVEFDDNTYPPSPERFCLTPLGIAERERLVAEGKIK